MVHVVPILSKHGARIIDPKFGILSLLWGIIFTLILVTHVLVLGRGVPPMYLLLVFSILSFLHP